MKAIQRKELLENQIHIPALNENGEEFYLFVNSCIKIVDSNGDDDEYNTKIKFLGKYYYVNSIDLDFLNEQ